MLFYHPNRQNLRVPVLSRRLARESPRISACRQFRKGKRHPWRDHALSIDVRGSGRYKRLFKVLPMSAGVLATFTPAACSAAIFSAAVPVPPEMIAPA